MILPKWYFQAKREGITLVENLFELETKRVFKKMMNDEGFPGATDFQTLSLIYHMIILTHCSKVLEIGTLIGWSGLFFLDALKKSQGEDKKFLVTLDPNQHVQSIAKQYLHEAGFENMIKFVPYASESTKAKKIVKEKQPYDLIFIDSKHNYENAKLELSFCFDVLKEGGLLFCHDTSELAAEYDEKKTGGVRKALQEFVRNNPIQSIFFESEGTNWNATGCFMGIKTRYKSNSS